MAVTGYTRVTGNKLGLSYAKLIISQARLGKARLG
jgi:hypothetical protein